MSEPRKDYEVDESSDIVYDKVRNPQTGEWEPYIVKGRDARAQFDAARLSHDRGADGDAVRSLVRRVATMDACSQTHHEHIAREAARVLLALSVPAPTLPALVFAAEEARDILIQHQAEGVKRDSGYVETVIGLLREALRDAV